MKKEKWLLKEIDNWQENHIVNEETANTLRCMYQPQKSISLLTVLFSIIGSLLIGMGIVLVIANNWWYTLPIAVRTCIGFLPLVLSQLVVLYVYNYKMESNAFRESAALLNMAGVFTSIAFISQIFHLPGEFENYMFACGVLFLPTMMIMKAVSPLIIYYWAAINGGLSFSGTWGLIVSLLMFAIGAVYALKKCSEKNGKSIFLSLVTVIYAFILILTLGIVYNCDISVLLYVYAFFLLSAAPILKACETVFSVAGRVCFLILSLVVSYQGLWGYSAEFESWVLMALAIVLSLLAVVFWVKNVLSEKLCLFTAATFVLLFVRVTWLAFGLSEEPFDWLFMVGCNISLFILSIICIFVGARNVDLYMANTGMVTLCTLVILRFFDSELAFSIRGVIFLLLGTGFLLFNLYIVKSKKKAKEEAK